jgi:hypothetical protein
LTDPDDDDRDFPIGGNGGISPICAAAAANKSASDIEPNVDDFDFLAGSGFVGGFFLGSRVEVDSGLLVFAPPLEAVAVAPPNKMLAMPEGNPLKPDEGSLDFCGFFVSFLYLGRF